MQTLKLISEAVEDVEYITEEKENGKKNYKIKGIFMQSDVKNRNGRVYPQEILAKEVAKYNKNFIKENRAYGAKLGVSSRGMGSLDQRNGANYVKPDFYLATAADIVADPSAPNAFVQGIMEGKEWVWNNGALLEAELSEMQRQFDVKKRQRDAKMETLAFAKFLKKL